MRSSSGLSIVELVVAVAISSLVVLAGGTMVQTAGAVSADATASDAADRRTAEVLGLLIRDVRRASLATVQQPDGSAFIDGATAAGLSYRPVNGYSGAPVLGPRAEVQLITPAGATSGDLVVIEDGVTRTVAREVTSFSVTRTGDVFAFTTTSRAGPADDRRRTGGATIRIVPRNP